MTPERSYLLKVSDSMVWERVDIRGSSEDAIRNWVSPAYLECTVHVIDVAKMTEERFRVKRYNIQVTRIPE